MFPCQVNNNASVRMNDKIAINPSKPKLSCTCRNFKETRTHTCGLLDQGIHLCNSSRCLEQGEPWHTDFATLFSFLALGATDIHFWNTWTIAAEIFLGDLRFN